MRSVTLGLLFSLLTACGGSSSFTTPVAITTDQSTLNLAGQNRQALQTNGNYTYFYTVPELEDSTESEEQTETESLASQNTSLPANVLATGLPEPLISPELSEAETPSTPEILATESNLFDTGSQTLPKAKSLKQASPFQLEDLKGQTQSFSFPYSKVMVLAFADQKGSEQMEDWIQPLVDRYADQIEIHGIAELSAVPSFARGIARGIISSLGSYPIMLDWTGSVSNSFAIKTGVTHLFVLDQDGYIHQEAYGQADLEKLKSIALALDQLLTE